MSSLQRAGATCADPFAAEIAALESRLAAARAAQDEARARATAPRPALSEINPTSLYTRDEVSALTRLSIFTLARREKAGLLRGRRIGGKAVRYLGADVLALVGGL